MKNLVLKWIGVDSPGYFVDAPTRRGFVWSPNQRRAMRFKSLAELKAILAPVSDEDWLHESLAWKTAKLVRLVPSKKAARPWPARAAHVSLCRAATEEADRGSPRSVEWCGILSSETWFRRQLAEIGWPPDRIEREVRRVRARAEGREQIKVEERWRVRGYGCGAMGDTFNSREDAEGFDRSGDGGERTISRVRITRRRIVKRAP